MCATPVFLWLSKTRARGRRKTFRSFKNTKILSVIKSRKTIKAKRMRREKRRRLSEAASLMTMSICRGIDDALCVETERKGKMLFDRNILQWNSEAAAAKLVSQCYQFRFDIFGSEDFLIFQWFTNKIIIYFIVLQAKITTSNERERERERDKYKQFNFTAFSSRLAFDAHAKLLHEHFLQLPLDWRRRQPVAVSIRMCEY